jgi:outer membrane protein OmpA-like peptidoglycan-associated protein
MQRHSQLSSELSLVRHSSFMLQRQCACGQHTTDQHGQCTECKKKGQLLQRRAVNQNGPEIAPPIVHEVLRSPGRPLDPATRAYMEPRFGHDFGQVRVHTDEQAALSASAVNAQAYTVGKNVVFAAGQYSPRRPTGMHLIAHELVHVMQQRNVVNTASLVIDSPTSLAEREAQRIASGGEGYVAETVSASIQRQPEPGDTRPRNVGPPFQEMPLPPRCSIIWKKGKWSWKCEGIPRIGSTPEIPLDPRDIPDRIRDLIPKGPGHEPGSGERTFPFPPTAEPELPPNWLETVCKRNPMSPLCIPPGKKQGPEQPSLGEILTRPIGVFWTTDVLFEHDQPTLTASIPNGGLTAAGTTALNTIIFFLNSDPTLRVRLIGHTSAEGTTAYNLDLSKRRVRLVYQKLNEAGLSGQIIDPIESDGKTTGCTRLEVGVWACGESQATQSEARPEERKVEATFLRNPPLPSGPLRLTPPQFGRDFDQP